MSGTHLAEEEKGYVEETALALYDQDKQKVNVNAVLLGKQFTPEGSPEGKREDYAFRSESLGDLLLSGWTDVRGHGFTPGEAGRYDYRGFSDRVEFTELVFVKDGKIVAQDFNTIPPGLRHSRGDTLWLIGCAGWGHPGTGGPTCAENLPQFITYSE